MDYVASYLLCVENSLEPSKANISKLLSAGCGAVDEAGLNEFVAKISGKTHDEILSAGSAMMTLRAAAAPAATGNAQAKKEEAQPEAESESSSDAAMDFF